jgi:deoxyhypusine synthase
MASTTNGVSAPPPSTVTDAVLKPSDPVPDDAIPVKGLDFDDFKDRNITVAELVENLKNVGFQATSIGRAVDIVNGMVSCLNVSMLSFPSPSIDHYLSFRKIGATPKLAIKPQSS